MGYVILQFRDNHVMVQEDSLIDAIDVSWHLFKTEGNVDVLGTHLSELVEKWQAYAAEASGMGIFNPRLDQWLAGDSEATSFVRFLDWGIDRVLMFANFVPLEIVFAGTRRGGYVKPPPVWSFVSAFGRLKALIEQGMRGRLPSNDIWIFYRGDVLVSDQDRLIDAIGAAIRILDQGQRISQPSDNQFRDRWNDYIASVQARRYPGTRIVDPWLDKWYSEDSVARSAAESLRTSAIRIVEDSSVVSSNSDVLRTSEQSERLQAAVLDGLAGLVDRGIERAIRVRGHAE